MPNLLSTGTPFAGQFGPDAILTAAGVPVTSTPVTVYQSDGTTAATLYTDQTKGTAAANPVNTDAQGNLTFFTAPGVCVLAFTVGGTNYTKTVMVSPWYLDGVWNGVVDTAASPTNVLDGDCRFANAASNAIAYTLPSPTLGARIALAKTDSTANLVTATTPSGTIQGLGLGTGSATITLGAQGANVILMADGTNWHVMAGEVNSGWTTISTFTNSWGAGSPAPAYVQMGPMVLLRGTLTAGTAATAAFTLPAGLRPQVAMSYACPSGAASANEIIVGTAGTVSPQTSIGTGLGPVQFPVF